MSKNICLYWTSISNMSQNPLCLGQQPIQMDFQKGKHITHIVKYKLLAMPFLSFSINLSFVYNWWCFPTLWTSSYKMTTIISSWHHWEKELWALNSRKREVLWPIPLHQLSQTHVIANQLGIWDHRQWNIVTTFYLSSLNLFNFLLAFLVL